MRPTARPVAKTIFSFWNSLTCGEFASKVQCIPSPAIERIALSPCSITITPSAYSTSFVRRGAIPTGARCQIAC